MKKLLIIFCLVSGALFVHAEKSAFLGLSGGVSFDSNFLAKPAFSIGIGKELQNSQGTHLGVARLGLWNGEFELNYGYSFLRTGNWSLGIEGSALFGIDRVYSSERTNRYLALGGGIGLYARLKLSRYLIRIPNRSSNYQRTC